MQLSLLQYMIMSRVHPTWPHLIGMLVSFSAEIRSVFGRRSQLLRSFCWTSQHSFPPSFISLLSSTQNPFLPASVLEKPKLKAWMRRLFVVELLRDVFMIIWWGSFFQRVFAWCFLAVSSLSHNKSFRPWWLYQIGWKIAISCFWLPAKPPVLFPPLALNIFKGESLPSHMLVGWEDSLSLSTSLLMLQHSPLCFLSYSKDTLQRCDIFGNAVHFALSCLHLCLVYRDLYWFALAQYVGTSAGAEWV